MIDAAAPSRLSLSALPTLRRVGVPRYVRGDLSPGIVHFGVGNFHRAHQAAHLDALMNRGLARDWAIVGAGVTPHDGAMREALAGQDWLTTLVEQSAEAVEARVIGPMVDFLPVGDVAATVARLADPATRIVSLTVTEGGYFLDASGAFDADHPAIRADAAAPDAPRTVFGLILAGLRARRGAGLQPFTVMCCDNIPHNGGVTRNAVAGLARLGDAGFADWVEAEVAFPDAMVDRITPATGERERRLCRERHGVDDAWPVFCEDFTQWVIEDRFPLGRPPLEQAGVLFTPDVGTWELMKLRILNGGHAAIAYPGGLLGIEFVHEAMAEPLIAGYLEKLTREEIIPVTPTPPGQSLEAYRALIASRFANPAIGDTVRRLCLDGSNRQPKFIVPAVRDRLAAGAPVEGLALVSALWRRYCAGRDETGGAIAPNDPRWESLSALAARPDPLDWLGMGEVYGEVGRAAPFRDAFARWAARIEVEGVRSALSGWLRG
ncbi:mannitol dehydrogenase family protein [Rubrimonas cliftonensis]|uniref:Mannitol 2-dehydrogenase n=1 Tax=Rubrimonas cliftonensis TaxID=89524 RepID=A0A1H4BT38_9RHOB|nr:mannitol dehydrogenase family protein [Rubrimonas cliftonensis]SEA51012.1 mannitol 2-dehydrogenase [Rubrimonas cliftonensis]